MKNSEILRKGYKMFTKRSSKMIFWFFLSALLTNVSMYTNATTNTAAGRRPPGAVEKCLLVELGLREDVNDSEIIQLLDISEKRILVTTLIRYRKISSAVPKLLQIFNDCNTVLPEKLSVADALCDFGNKEWMPTIKSLSLDPNSVIARTPLKIKVAGLLARAGDYSQFEILKNSLTDTRDYIRSKVVYELRNFGHKTDPITDSAVKLLTSVAISDTVPKIRNYAIESMEKIAKEKPEVTAKIIAALEANKDSPDKDFRIICKTKLDIYHKKLKDEKKK